MKGLTLVEIVLVISIIVVITALAIPSSLRFFQIQTIDEIADNIIDVLRRSQSQAALQRNDSSFGVKFNPGSYVLFQGNSYVGRDVNEDEVFSLPSDVIVSGINEIIFSKLSGFPSSAGTITINISNDSRIISINSQGKINR